MHCKQWLPPWRSCRWCSSHTWMRLQQSRFQEGRARIECRALSNIPRGNQCRLRRTQNTCLQRKQCIAKPPCRSTFLEGTSHRISRELSSIPQDNWYKRRQEWNTCLQYKQCTGKPQYRSMRQHCMQNRQTSPQTNNCSQGSLDTLQPSPPHLP